LGQIDFVISILYVVLLGSIGSMMLVESLYSLMVKKKNIKSEFNSFKVSSFASSLPLKMRFPRSKLYISALIPASVGFVGGILASILGVGAGFLLVPAMIYIIRMPSLIVAGTSLFQIVFTTALVGILHAVANNTVDVLLGVILIAGGVIGTQFGVGFAGKIKGLHARIILAILILVVSVQLAGQLVIPPDDLFSTVIRK
jgi:uncharacterized membrane protein YfcA